MSGIAQIRTAPSHDSSTLDARVRRTAIVVPVVIVSAGSAASAIDLRLGFIASAIVAGWTQLVGL
jgi:hypothetical protein